VKVLLSVQETVSMYRTLQQCVLENKMNFDNVTEIIKFGRKEYPNIHMEEVNSVRQWQRYTVSSAQTPSLSWHTYKVDAMCVSLTDEPLARPSHAYVCFIRGISLDAFESR
jgi:hypothetical protein